MSSADRFTDQLHCDLIGWPLSPPVVADKEIVADLRAMLADRRRRQLRESSVPQSLLERVQQLGGEAGS